jgi:hypothetical protein
MRLGGQYASVEQHLLRQFKKYAYQSLEEKGNEWFWLSVGQHYGLPTRLLDWSYSPDVALHFATANTSAFDRDGAVWKVNYKAAHQSLPAELLQIIEGESGAWILTTEVLGDMVRDLRTLDSLGKKHGAFLLFFEPPSIDERIFNQFSYFSMLSRPDLSLDTWLNDHREFWQKVIIPKELKWEIRDKLDQRNISERVLFPGLDGLCRWLARNYLPTGSAAQSQVNLQPPGCSRKSND